MSYRSCYGVATAGPAGPAGPFVTGAQIQPNGDVIFTLSDGATLNAGPIPYDLGNEPWRIAGPLGADGAQAQPTSADDVNVTDTIQHTAKVLIGGAPGDLIDPLRNPQLEVIGHIQTRGGVYSFYDPARPPGLQRVLIEHSMTVPGDEDAVRFTFRTDAETPDGSTQFTVSRHGNWSNNYGLLANGAAGARRTLFLNGLGTVPPSGPVTADTVAVWATGNPAELFVMDGAGNVTQLSSHPTLADAIFAEVDEAHADLLGHYQFSYNVYSGVGQIAAVSGRRIVFDIDSGHYILYAPDGAELDQGDNPDLAAFGTQHPLPDGFDGSRGPDYLAHVQAAFAQADDPHRPLEPSRALHRQFALREKLRGDIAKAKRKPGKRT
jgi:hypothetical protein